MPAYEHAGFDPPAPVARVALRNPATGQTCTEVPMLLDSGADVTLVPERAAHDLGLSTNGPQYELIGVEGMRIVASAVSLELRFLRRLFRGQFLLTHQPCGVLGRNVINNIPLLLDGPSLSWNEVATSVREPHSEP